MTSPEDFSSTPTAARGRLARLALKELRETLRDRRTLITLVLMPLLVYPLLGVILQKAMLSAVTEPDEPEFGVAFCSPEEATRFKQLMLRGTQSQQPSGELTRMMYYVPENADPDCDPEKLVTEAGVDLAVRFRMPTVRDENGKLQLPQVELFYRKSSSVSQELVLEIEGFLQAANREIIQREVDDPRRLMNQGYAHVVLSPITPEKTVGASFSLSTFVPLMLILMTVTGAVYPAIDLTAGERERGTLEVLVAAPVSRMELLGAKFVAVLTVAMLTAVVNLIAMLITVYASGLEQLVFGDQGLSVMIIGQILGLLGLFAAFFSAVLLALTSFARSFKEAQAYLIPLMLVSLAPGIFSLTPGLEINGLLAVTPLVNIVLLGRDLFQGQADGWLFAGAIMSTVLYALLALSLAARVFGSDAILYGSQGSLKDLFQRPKHPRPLPTLTQVVFALAALFPGFVILGSLPGRFAELSMTARLAMSATVTILLFAIWPAFMAWRNAVRLKSGFRAHSTPLGFFAVSLFWGCSLWMIAYELEILVLSTDRLSALGEVFETIKTELDQVPFAWRLMTLAVVPAVCEELFFRGYLLAGLQPRMSKTAAVFVSAGLFGLFHVVVRDVLFFERFLPSGFMGVMLGWLAVRSGSVWPGIVLHVLHNGLLLTIAHYQAELMEWNIDMESRVHLPGTWLAGASVSILIGIFLVTRTKSNSNHDPN